MGCVQQNRGAKTPNVDLLEIRQPINCQPPQKMGVLNMEKPHKVNSNYWLSTMAADHANIVNCFVDRCKTSTL